MKKKSKVSTFADIILMLVFVGLIWLIPAGSIFRPNTQSGLEEKRKLAEFPDFKIDSIESIPEKVENYYKDHYWFREPLIKSHNWIKYKFLKGSSTGNVLMGKDNWLFLSKSGIIIDYLGRDSLTNEELERWKTLLEKRKAWLQERGIHYLFVIAPNKISVYPEHLPDHLYDDNGQTRMDQLLDFLHLNSTVPYLDLRKPLHQAKETGLIYYPNDTHWTDRGVLVVYSNICKKLSQFFPDIQSYNLGDFIIQTKPHKGDLAMMLGLGDELVLECESLIPLIPGKAQLVDFELPDGNYLRDDIARQQIATEREDSKHRLLIFHDSFWTRGELYKLAAEHFSRMVCVDGIADMAILKVLVELEHPDIVIEELSERKLKAVVSSTSD
jgi:alginate O-acetyltransferase complex protein AlgJ